MLRCVQLLQAGPQRRLGRLRRPVVYAPCLPAVFLPSPKLPAGWIGVGVAGVSSHGRSTTQPGPGLCSPVSCSPDKQTAKAERKPSTRTQGCGLDYSLHRRPHRRSSVRERRRRGTARRCWPFLFHTTRSPASSSPGAHRLRLRLHFCAARNLSSRGRC